MHFDCRSRERYSFPRSTFHCFCPKHRRRDPAKADAGHTKGNLNHDIPSHNFPNPKRRTGESWPREWLCLGFSCKQKAQSILEVPVGALRER